MYMFKGGGEVYVDTLIGQDHAVAKSFDYVGRILLFRVQMIHY